MYNSGAIFFPPFTHGKSACSICKLMRFSSSSDTPGPKSSCAFWSNCAKEPPEHIS